MISEMIGLTGQVLLDPVGLVDQAHRVPVQRRACTATGESGDTQHQHRVAGVASAPGQVSTGTEQCMSHACY